METALNAAGGLGIFLLAMAMMTSGLKVFGGERLHRLMARWTSNPFRAVLTGAVVTGVVQSSSAVTVATIGFVNAGILSLRQSLGVVFGANVGTTMTGWLVSLIGINLKIDTLALPIIAVGVALRVAVQSRRLRGLGDALAGFGLFFLGLAILKDAFSGVADSLGTMTLQDVGTAGIALFVAIGVAATVLTHSSSAAIALILTAASETAIGFEAAAAAVIGANIGTTSTAAFAVIGATPNARRVAAGHIVFNLCTGLIALAILPFLLSSVGALGRLFALEDNPAVALALFHTVFNVLGIVVLLPLIGPLSNGLQRIFTTSEEEISRPRFLDGTVAATPAFAMLALGKELRRMHEIVCHACLASTRDDGRETADVEARSEAIRQLAREVRTFAVTLRMDEMPLDIAESLPRELRINRYLQDAADATLDVRIAALESRRHTDGTARSEIVGLLDTARDCIEVCRRGPPEERGHDAPTAARARFETVYQHTKSALLRSAARHELPVETVDRLLDGASRCRRMIGQLVKATVGLGGTDADLEDRDRDDDLLSARPDDVPAPAAAQTATSSTP